ncbi:MAG: DUF4398 domain-containing protein [Sphingomonadaceae bacterium]
MRTFKLPPSLAVLFAIMLAAGLTACASDKIPATAGVAVSRAAVDSATSSDAAELAPVEMQAAREKLMSANQALAAKDYKAAQMWATAAEADAKLAQSKANSAKATTAANQLQDSIRVLREELDRKPAQ